MVLTAGFPGEPDFAAQILESRFQGRDLCYEPVSGAEV